MKRLLRLLFHGREYGPFWAYDDHTDHLTTGREVLCPREI